jgi:hypothetical protein
MSGILDNFLVGLALIVSAAYAVASLGPKSVRRRLLGGLGRLLARAPAFLHLQRAARKFTVASAGKPPGACGGCDSCGSDQDPSHEPPESEINVPVAAIGRRNAAGVKSSGAAGSDLR